MPGTYDSDSDSIRCTRCDWMEFGIGPTAAAWAMHDHDIDHHPEEVDDARPQS